MTAGQEFSAKVKQLASDIGPMAAVGFTLMGLEGGNAKRVFDMAAGKRLLSHDPAAFLSDAKIAAVLGCGVAEFAQMVGRNFPEPDRPGGGTEFSAGCCKPVLRAWKCGTVAKWLSNGCPDPKTGLPNAFLAERYSKPF